MTTVTIRFLLLTGLALVATVSPAAEPNAVLELGRARVSDVAIAVEQIELRCVGTHIAITGTVAITNHRDQPLAGNPLSRVALVMPDGTRHQLFRSEDVEDYAWTAFSIDPGSRATFPFDGHTISPGIEGETPVDHRGISGGDATGVVVIWDGDPNPATAPIPITIR